VCARGASSPAVGSAQLWLQVRPALYRAGLPAACMCPMSACCYSRPHARRYGIQIGQAFGFDFGYGIIKDICFVSFAIV